MKPKFFTTIITIIILILFLVQPFIITILWTITKPVPVLAAEISLSQDFSPPSTVKLTTFALHSDGSINYRDYDDPHCTSTGPTSTAHGCTWYYQKRDTIGETVQSYPFNSYEIEISYQSEIVNGVEQGYLANVVPQEVGIHSASQGIKPLACVMAFAIAVRTYAFNQTYNVNNPADTLRINNSAEKQVYIPYRYDALNTSQQSVTLEAISELLYMSLPNSTLPIRANYGEDNGARTVGIDEVSYLKATDDPISADHGSNSNPNGGMSAKGCSRWAFGHTSSRGPDDPDKADSLYPHDNQGNGNFWSMQWDSPLQILFNYYAGVIIRDATP